MTNWETLRIGSSAQLGYPVSSVPTPATVSIAKAFWVLKKSLDDLDAAAVLTLSITPTPTAQGVISDTGAIDGVALLSFVVGSGALAPLDPSTTYFRTIKVILSNGQASAPADPVAPVRILSAGSSLVA